MLKCNNDNKTQIMDNITKTIETYNQIYDDYSQRNGKANPINNWVKKDLFKTLAKT
jgi:hypothetical protein